MEKIPAYKDLRIINIQRVKVEVDAGGMHQVWHRHKCRNAEQKGPAGHR